MARRKLNPDQIPLLTPDSTWTIPKELPDLTKIGEFGLDTETKDEGLMGGRGPGWAFKAGYVAGVGVSWFQGSELKKIYAPLRHPDSECFPKENVARWLKDITKNNRVVFQNAGYDIGWMEADLGVPVPRTIDDVGCMAIMIDENRRGYKPYSLDSLCKWRGIESKKMEELYEAAEIYGVRKEDAVANIWRLPARYAGPYGEQDPASTLMLAHDLREEIVRQGLLAAYQTEMRLVPMVHAMRKRGIRIDIDAAERLRDGLLARSQRALDQLSDRLKMRVGMDEVRSNGWLVRTFSNENVSYVTETNDADEETASFKKEWMRRGCVEKDGKPHWLPLLVAEARQAHEAANKFVQSYLLDYAHLGRVHASINQFKTDDGGTRSHRFSYSDPPLQQAPSRPDPVESWTMTWEIAAAYRGAFLPEEGELWYSPDYSQQEYRLIVHYAETLGCAMASEAADKYRGDPKTDFHNLVVEMTGLPRRRAKDVNFAKSYGAGVYKFSQMTGMTMEESKETIAQYDTKLPFVKELSQRCSKRADHVGYIRMIDGARSHFDDWEVQWIEKDERDRGFREGYQMLKCSRDEAEDRVRQEGHPWFGKRLKRAETHKAMNRLIQGSAARQMKIAMAQCWEEGFVPMLQMHDELSFSLNDPKAGVRIEEIMRTCVETRVPMLVDAEWGPTWGQAKHTYIEAKALAGGTVATGRRAKKSSK